MPRRAPPPPAVRAPDPACRIWRDPATRTYVVTCFFPSAIGTSKLSMVLPERQVRNMLRVSATAGEAELGNIFTAIGRGFAAIHKNAVVQNVAAGALALYGVPPGVTKAGMQLAGDLAQKAADGEPRARRREAQIEQAAARGVPAARRARAAIEHARSSRRMVRLSVELLERAARGDERARRRLLEIAAGARRRHPPAERAARAVRVVLATGYQQSRQPGRQVQPAAALFPALDATASVQRGRPRQPPPPVVRGGYETATAAPPPPAVSATSAYQTAMEQLH